MQEASGSFTLFSCKKMYTKQMCCTCKVTFFLIRLIVAFSPFSLPSPLSITRFYILFEQTINIIESFALAVATLPHLPANVPKTVYKLSFLTNTLMPLFITLNVNSTWASTSLFLTLFKNVLFALW